MLTISIITATLNQAPLLRQCIECVRSQTIPSEHIIVDACSRDGTVDIIKSYSHIAKWVSEPDNGIYDALNKGLKMAGGDIVGFLHADDFYASSGVLESVVASFEQNKTDCCYGDLVYVGQGNTDRIIRTWRSRPFERSLLEKGWMPPHPAFFVRRAIYEKYGGFDTSFRIAADYELMVRFLGRYGIPASYIPDILVKMRTGGTSNKSLRNIIQKSLEDYRIIRMHDLGGLTTLLRKNLSKLPQFFSGREA